MTLTAAVSEPLAAGLRLSLAPLEYALLIIYFVFVIGIGFALRRFDRKTHLITALIFVVASVLIAGVNLYALAFVLESLLGIPLAIAIIASALFVISYFLLGGLSSAIYNEVMQFIVILLALIP